METVVVCRLGRVEYRAAWALQQRVQARLIADKRSAAPQRLPHVLLTVEHPPVFTLGPSGDTGNVLLSEAALDTRGASLVATDRGGDVTFHGPGQLVAYPLLDLDRFFTDIHRYLRTLEESVIGVCADYGLDAGRVPGRTGVWIGPDARGPERKACAFGIRCSRWVTMHGLALNVNTDLGWFDAIVPCGIADRGVTSLAAELGRPVDADEAERRFLARFAEQFGVRLDVRDGAEAQAWLDAFAPDESEAVGTLR